MPNIKIADLKVSDNLLGSDYLIVDNSITTKKAALSTIVGTISSLVNPNSLNNAVRALSSAALDELIIALSANVPAALNSLVNAVSTLSAVKWNNTYTTVYSNSAVWNNTFLKDNYGITDNSIQIKGEVFNKTLTLYTALFLTSIAGLTVGNTVQDSNNGKVGVLKYIDGDNLIAYVKENNTTTNFNVGSILQGGTGTIRSIETFEGTILPNHSVKIFNATDNTLSAAPASNLNVTAISPYADLPTLYNYKIAQFKFSDGKISSISTETATTSCYNRDPDFLNNTNLNRLSITRTSTDYGVLVYRRENSSIENDGYRLISVLGERELGAGTINIPYLDRGGFNTNTWASNIKDTTNGDIKASSIYYFPVNAEDLTQSKYDKGFTVARLSAFTNRQTITINKQLTGVTEPVDIFIDSSATYDKNGVLVGGFKKAILDNATGIIPQIYILNGNYYTSTITLTSNIIIEGESKKGVTIKSLPWEFNSSTKKSSIITAVKEHDISVKSLTLDGNYANNTGWSTFENNFIVNNKEGEYFNYENIDVKNSVGGGIYALEASNFKLINSEIKSGAIELADDSRVTGLYAQQASSFILNTNNFEGWLGAIDLAVTRVGSAANNVIKNCGTGLLVYGATSLQVSPNLIMGQDNEAIPVSDLFDSKFDAINIELEQNQDFISDIILYMRDGSAAWLSSLTIGPSAYGTNVTLTTNINTLVKTDGHHYILPLSSFNYSTYNTNVPTISIISTEESLQQGRVQFKLTNTAVNSLSTYGQLKLAYSNLTNRPIGETLVGLVYKIKATEYLFTNSETDDLINIKDYQFNNNNTVNLYPTDVSDISLFSVNDIIYGINLTSGQTQINNQDLTVQSIYINYVNDQIGVAYLVCSGNYEREDGDIPGAVFTCPATGSRPSYVGIKNNFVISKGTINKI